MYPQFDEVVEALAQVLDEMIAPHYQGWMGVDMLLFNAQSKGGENEIGINPCVELNLRPTMGAITSVIGDTMLATGTAALFRIEQRTTSSTPWPQAQDAVVENGRLVAGTLQLTPPSTTALYRAVLEVMPCELCISHIGS